MTGFTPAATNLKPKHLTSLCSRIYWQSAALIVVDRSLFICLLYIFFVLINECLFYCYVKVTSFISLHRLFGNQVAVQADR